VGELVGRDVLEQEPACAGAQRLVDVLVHVERGQDDDLARQGVGPADDLPGRREAVHRRHPDVHQDDVGPQPAGLRHRVHPVDRRPDDREIGFGVQDQPQAGAHQLLVVDDQDADRHAAAPSTVSRARTR
jgi:hypothetical protein